MTIEWNRFDGKGGPLMVGRNIALRMSDGVTLYANVYRPDDDARHPCIVNMGPYGKDVPMRSLYPERWSRMIRQYPDVLSGSTGALLQWETPDPERWAPYGYVTAHIDARGTCASEGSWDPLSARETTDYAESIEWISQQVWSNGRVGILGVSYYAMAAWKVAQVAPPGLKAIIPWHGCGDLYREFVRHGGILAGFADLWWYRWSRDAAAQVGTNASLDDVVAWPEEVRARPLDDDWYRERSADWAKVRVPFLSVGSWGTVGLHLRGSIDGFDKAASDEKWLHVIAGKQARLEQFHSDRGIELQKRFLDRYLLEDGSSWVDVPPVTVEVRLPGGGTRDRTARRWPLESTSWARLHLDAIGRSLTQDVPEEPASTGFHPLSDGIAFRSGAFTAECEVTGPLTLKLSCSTTARDMDIFVTLRILDSEGCRVDYQRVFEKAVTRGWLRLSQRETSSSLSTDWQPHHPHTRVLDVVPDEIYPLEIEIWPTSFVIPAGGRVVIQISGKDAADTEQTRHNDPTDRPSDRFWGISRFHTGGNHSSYLLLPLQDLDEPSLSELIEQDSGNTAATGAAY